MDNQEKAVEKSILFDVVECIRQSYQDVIDWELENWHLYVATKDLTYDQRQELLKNDLKRGLEEKCK